MFCSEWKETDASVPRKRHGFIRMALKTESMKDVRIKNVVNSGWDQFYAFKLWSNLPRVIVDAEFASLRHVEA